MRQVLTSYGRVAVCFDDCVHVCIQVLVCCCLPRFTPCLARLCPALSCLWLAPSVPCSWRIQFPYRCCCLFPFAFWLRSLILLEARAVLCLLLMCVILIYFLSELLVHSFCQTLPRMATKVPPFFLALSACCLCLPIIYRPRCFVASRSN